MLSSFRGSNHEFCIVIISFSMFAFSKASHHLYMTAYNEVAGIFCQEEQTSVIVSHRQMNEDHPNV